MKRVRGIGIVTVAVALSSCALLGDLDEGAGAFPSPGPVPPVGTVWESTDGSAGVRLTAPDTVDVWGLPWYIADAGCEPEHLEYLTTSMGVRAYTESGAPRLKLVLDTSALYDDGWHTESRSLYRDSGFRGWQVLNYTSCYSFNDGHNLELHMVGAASVPSSSSP